MRRMLFIALLFVACNHDSGYLWPDGEIPFNAIGFSNDELFDVEKTMTTWEIASGGKIKFINLMFDNDYKIKNGITPLTIIKMKNLHVAALTTGYGYKKNMCVFMQKYTDRILLHELGHVIGFIHEHQRLDRDMYIKYNLSGCPPLLVPQFVYEIPVTYDYTKYPYDIHSIMHYSIEDSGYIITSPADCGGNSISPVDALKVQDMYSR